MKRITWGLALLSLFAAAGCCCPSVMPGGPELEARSFRQIGDGPFAVVQTTAALDVAPSSVPQTVPSAWNRVGLVDVAIDDTGPTLSSEEDFRLVEGEYRPPSSRDRNVSIGFTSLGTPAALPVGSPEREFHLQCIWPVLLAPPQVPATTPSIAPLKMMIYDGWYALWQGHAPTPVAYVQSSGDVLVYYLSADYRWPSKDLYPDIVVHYEYLKPRPSPADLQALGGWQTILCWGNK